MAPCDAFGDMYPAPLEIECESTEIPNGHAFKFLETWTQVSATTGGFAITHALKSWIRKKQQGKPPLKNVVHFGSHAPEHQKFGFVVGTLIRAMSNSLGLPAKQQSMSRALEALYDFGLSDELAARALVRVRHIDQRKFALHSI